MILSDEPTIGVDLSNITEIEKKHVQMHVSEDDHDVGWYEYLHSCTSMIHFNNRLYIFKGALK